MMSARLALGAAAAVLLSASAVAEPATATSAVNLRSGASTGSAIIGKIPAGSLVQASDCSDWCKVEWQGKRGFAIAASLDRRGRAPQRAAAKRDPDATDNNPVPMSLPKVGDTPQRDQGPYIWGTGPGIGMGGFGYRGRW
jgi:uncharacterized protein YraI